MGDTNGRNSIALRKRGPWLFVTVDAKHHLALLRGTGTQEVIDALGLDARYSKYGHGWVIAIADVSDVVAYGEYSHELIVVSDRKQVA